MGSWQYLACSAGVFIGRARMVLIAKAPCWNSRREEGMGLPALLFSPSHLPKGSLFLLSPIFLCHKIKDGGFIVSIRLISFRSPKIRLHCRLDSTHPTHSEHSVLLLRTRHPAALKSLVFFPVFVFLFFELLLSWLSTSVCQILFCPFRIVHISFPFN